MFVYIVVWGFYFRTKLWGLITKRRNYKQTSTLKEKKPQQLVCQQANNLWYIKGFINTAWLNFGSLLLCCKHYQEKIVTFLLASNMTPLGGKVAFVRHAVQYDEYCPSVSLNIKGFSMYHCSVELSV